MSSIYEIYSQGDGHPYLDHDLKAYLEAQAAGDAALAEQILRDARNVVAKVRLGEISRPAMPPVNPVFENLPEQLHEN